RGPIEVVDIALLTRLDVDDARRQSQPGEHGSFELDALLAPHAVGPDGALERAGDQLVPDVAEAQALTVDQIEPGGHLEPEGDRDRVLTVSPPGHEGVPMPRGEVDQDLFEAVETRGDELQRILEDESLP